MSSQPNPPAVENLSPFVEWANPDDAAIPAELVHSQQDDGILVALLRSPGTIVQRLRRADQLVPLTTAAMLTVLAGAALFAVVAARNETWWFVARSAIGAGLAFVTATAAAISPIYGVSLLLNARLPMARLTACLAAAGGTAALVLAAESPLVLTLLRLEPVFFGPFGVLLAYAVAGLSGGLRLHRLLVELAMSTVGRPQLNDDELFRVGILARVATMTLTLTLSLALWTFNVLGTR